MLVEPWGYAEPQLKITALGSQLTGDMVINPVVGCQYFTKATKRPLTNIKIYCLVTEGHTCVNNLQCSNQVTTWQCTGWVGVEPGTLRSPVQHEEEEEEEEDFA